MAENAGSLIELQDGTRDFRTLMIHRPTLHVDRGAAEDFYLRVFGRSSTPLESVMKTPPRPNHAIDYSMFTSVSDVFIDNLDPKRYITDGIQRFPDAGQGHLRTFGWYIEGMPELYRELRRHGIRVTNGQGQVAEGDDTPMAGPIPHFRALPADAGIGYQFFPMFPFEPDPRLKDGWSIPAVSEDDPLGIEYCSHHTVLTGDPARALELVVDVLGGTVLDEGHDDVRGLTGTYVHLADAIVQYAMPDEGSAAAADLAANGPDDVYHAITWKVVDIERVERHLGAQGVRILTRTRDTIVTDPATSLGVPWGFTTKQVPGDPR